MIKTPINPEGMAANPAYSQAIAVSGPHKTLYVGGQNGVDATGAIVDGGIAAQTTQALRNMALVLQAGDAGFNDVVKWTIHVVAGEDLRQAFAAFQAEVPHLNPAPAIGMAYVSGLGRPGFLIEIEAIAVVG